MLHVCFKKRILLLSIVKSSNSRIVDRVKLNCLPMVRNFGPKGPSRTPYNAYPIKRSEREIEKQTDYRKIGYKSTDIASNSNNFVSA